ncbi:MAG: hypothetical protein QMB48_04390, partial [Burkholderiaceae bacterium]
GVHIHGIGFGINIFWKIAHEVLLGGNGVIFARNAPLHKNKLCGKSVACLLYLGKTSPSLRYHEFNAALCMSAESKAKTQLWQKKIITKPLMWRATPRTTKLKKHIASSR